MKEEHWALVQPLLIEACSGLFASYGTRLSCLGELGHAILHEDGMAAFIGFPGEQVRGHLVIGMPLPLVAQTLPPELAELSRQPADPLGLMQDWIAELANQLLGRFKNRLLS